MASNINMADTASAEEAPNATAVIADEAPHLLVVDDDRRIRTLLSRYLRENGYRISTADNAAAAREKLRGLAFDLIVLDVMMPGESGWSLPEACARTTTSRS